MKKLELIIDSGQGSLVEYDKLDLNSVTKADKESVNLGDTLLSNVRTISFKFTPTVTLNSLSSTSVLLDRHQASSIGDVFIAVINGTGKIRMSRRVGFNFYFIDSNSNSWNAGQEYYLSMVLHPVNGMEMWIDGVKQSTTHINTSPTDTVLVDTYIGGRGFDGTLYERFTCQDFVVWNDARTGPELISDMTTTFTGLEAGLKAYFPFKNESGFTTNDINLNYAGVISTLNVGGITHVNNVIRVPYFTGSAGDPAQSFEFDLFDDEPISVTRKGIDINKLSERSSGTTNSFKLPLTANNNRIFNFLEVDGNTSNFPYELNYVRYTEDSVEIIPKGRINVNSITDSYNVDIIHGINDFFDLIRGKFLYEAFNPYQNLLTDMFAPTIVQSNDVPTQLAEGVVIPLCDYGFTNPVPEYQQSPNYFVQFAFEKICEHAGFTFVNPFNLFDDLVLGSDKLFDGVGDIETVSTFQNVIGGESVSINRFKTQQRGTISSIFNIVPTVIAGSPVAVLETYADGVLIDTYVPTLGVTSNRNFGTFPVDYPKGTLIELFIKNTATPADIVQFNIGDLGINESGIGIAGSFKIYHENILKEYLQTDFISEIFKLFNLNVEVNESKKTVELYKVNETMSKTLGNTIDLSPYFDNIIKKDYVNKYGKVNYFRYKYLNDTRDFYDHFITANNIKQDIDLIESDFTGSFYEKSVSFGNAVPYIMTTEGYSAIDVGTKSNNIGFRVNRLIRYNDTPSTPVSVFYRNVNVPAGTFNLSGNQSILTNYGLDWETLIGLNYNNLRDNILNRYVEYEVSMNTPSYINRDFSFKDKVFIDALNSNFVVTEITTKPNGLSVWKLIKIN